MSVIIADDRVSIIVRAETLIIDHKIYNLLLLTSASSVQVVVKSFSFLFFLYLNIMADSNGIIYPYQGTTQPKTLEVF